MAIAAVSRGRIAGNVRAEVARQQLEQERIALALGQNQQYVSRRITGAVPWRADELEVVANVLGVHVAELVGGRAPEGWQPPQQRDGESSRRTRQYLRVGTVLTLPRNARPLVEHEHLAPVISLADRRARQAVAA